LKRVGAELFDQSRDSSATLFIWLVPLWFNVKSVNVD